MANTTPTTEALRAHAGELFTNIGVSRIIVVDDEYAAADLEELIGICASVDPTLTVALPHLDEIDFDAPGAIWTDAVREVWDRLNATGRQELVAAAQTADAAEPPQMTSGDEAEQIEDSTAASSLEDILGQLDDCEFLTLSFGEWNQRSATLLADQSASSTVLLFDRDFSREKDGTTDGGFELIREVQTGDAGYCGLISHTVPLGSEYDAWLQLANEYELDRDRFVVISKARLTGDARNYYGFLGMLRLVALSDRFTVVKLNAWSIFQDSLDDARQAMERLSVFDFDRIVFESSRREGVWEPDTLFRIFGILLRRQAQLRLHGEVISSAVADARRVSAVAEEIAKAVRDESPSLETLRIQRFEAYESGEDLNRSHAPVELGDIFETVSNNKRYILLAQSCDLMVRSNGKRAYDDKLGRTATLLEVVEKEPGDKGSSGKLPFYNDMSGESAFVNFGRSHQVKLAVLDLCAVRADASATIQVNADAPDLLIPSWQARYKKLKQFFKTAVERWESLASKQVDGDLKSLALPRLSTTLRVNPAVSGETVQYGLRRVMRLRQPRSGALLTSFAQHQARAAFQHDFDPHADVEGER